MSNKMLRRFIVKVSVLGYFPLLLFIWLNCKEKYTALLYVQ